MCFAEAASTSDAVSLITYVQQLKREVLAWEKQVDIYREAQRILERQRFEHGHVNHGFIFVDQLTNLEKKTKVTFPASHSFEKINLIVSYFQLLNQNFLSNPDSSSLLNGCMLITSKENGVPSMR